MQRAAPMNARRFRSSCAWLVLGAVILGFLGCGGTDGATENGPSPVNDPDGGVPTAEGGDARPDDAMPRDGGKDGSSDDAMPRDGGEDGSSLLGVPDVLFSRVSFPNFKEAWGMALDAQYIYITNGSLASPAPGEFPASVIGIAKAGGTAVLKRGYHAYAIASDGRDVFWTAFETRNGNTWHLLHGGGFSRPSQTLDEQTAGVPIALATQPLDPYVYAVLRADGSGAIARYTKGSFMRQPMRMGTPLTGTNFVNNTGLIAVDSASVFWCDPSGGAVRRIATGGGATEDVATGQTSPRAVAVDAQGGDVFWVNAGPAGSLMKRAKSGGVPSVVAANLHTPVALAIDATHVYVVTWGPGSKTGSVLRVERAGGAVTELARGEAFPSAIATDDARIYWIASAAVKALPKP